MFKLRFSLDNFSESFDPFGANFRKIQESVRAEETFSRLDVEASFRESMTYIDEAMKKWKVLNQKQQM